MSARIVLFGTTGYTGTRTAEEMVGRCSRAGTQNRLGALEAAVGLDELVAGAAEAGSAEIT
jgi:hypothetical protein